MTTALWSGLRQVSTLAADTSPDGELLERFLASQDEGAFALLVRRHGPMVFGTCRRVLGNAPDADDAFQAAFVVLVRKAHALTAQQCVGSFLYGVAVRTALKARVMAAKRRVKEAKATRPDLVEEPTNSQELLNVELSRVLDEELAGLPEKYRGPVVLCELEGVSRKDAAIRLGIPEGTISGRLSTAHQMLAKRLRARGFGAIGLSVLLGDRASAVPRAVVDATIRSAVDGPPVAIAELVYEVSKMLLLNKVRAGVKVLGVVLLLGVGLGVVGRGFAAGDRPELKAPALPSDEKLKKKEALKQLFGLWTSQSVTFDPPIPVPGWTPPQHEWAINAHGLTWTTKINSGVNPPEVESRKWKYDLNPSTKLKELDLGAIADPQRMEWVYKLDGDTLTAAAYVGCLGRPIAFTAKESPPGPGRLMVIRFTRENTDAKKLLGRWVQTKCVTDPPQKGETAEPQYIWTFDDKGQLHTEATLLGKLTTGNNQYTIAPLAQPKELTISSSGVVRIQCIYELDGDTLRVAMYGLSEKARPSSFTTTSDTPKGVGELTVLEFRRDKKEGGN